MRILTISYTVIFGLIVAEANNAPVEPAPSPVVDEISPLAP